MTSRWGDTLFLGIIYIGMPNASPGQLIPYRQNPKGYKNTEEQKRENITHNSKEGRGRSRRVIHAE